MNWYSLDRNLKTCEHPPIDLDRALAIVEEYSAQADKTFDSAEEAISATMFGFSRSSVEFIEFCINGPHEISFKFEMANSSASWLSRTFGGTLQFDTVLRAKREAQERVREFFESSPAAFKARLKGAK